MVPTEFDIIPFVYYRLTKTLANNAILPNIDLMKVFDSEQNFKFECTVSTPAEWFNNKNTILDYLKKDGDMKENVVVILINLLKSNINKALEEKIIKFYSEVDINISYDTLIEKMKEEEKDITKYL